MPTMLGAIPGWPVVQKPATAAQTPGKPTRDAAAKKSGKDDAGIWRAAIRLQDPPALLQKAGAWLANDPPTVFRGGGAEDEQAEGDEHEDQANVVGVQVPRSDGQFADERFHVYSSRE